MQTEMEDKNDRGTSLVTMRPLPETDFFLQWGNRKRLRCVRIRSNNTSPPQLSSSAPHLSSSNSTRIRRRITSRFLSVTSNDEKHLSYPQPSTRNSEAAVTLRPESLRVSPEKEERSYTTRGSVPVVTNLEENGGGKVPPADVNGRGRGHGAAPGNQGGDEHTNYYHINYKNHNYSNRGGGGGGNLTWPKLCITLSSKEKEEDFLAMKGCKLPQRPKKRAKLIQRTVLLVCPGAWLSDMSLERYEVREKKTSKKRPRGLKAMGNMESDSE